MGGRAKKAASANAFPLPLVPAFPVSGLKICRRHLKNYCDLGWVTNSGTDIIQGNLLVGASSPSSSHSKARPVPAALGGLPPSLGCKCWLRFSVKCFHSDCFALRPATIFWAFSFSQLFP